GIAEGSSLHSASKLVLAVANVTVTAAPALMMATAAAAVIAAARALSGGRRHDPTTWRSTATSRGRTHPSRRAPTHLPTPPARANAGRPSARPATPTPPT